MACCFLEETHPDEQSRGHSEVSEASDAAVMETPLLPAQGAVADAPADLTTDSYGTFNSVEVQQDEIWRVRPNGDWIELPVSEKVFTKRVIMSVIALGIFTYHSVSNSARLYLRLACPKRLPPCCFASPYTLRLCMLTCFQMTYDHLLPIFLQDKRFDDNINALGFSSISLGGGLGIPIQRVGIILSINGIIQLSVQAFVFPLLADCFGVWRLLLMVTVAHPIAYFIVPFLQLLPPNLLYPGLFLCLTVRNLTSILAFPLLLIMIKESAPDKSHLGKINGLAASTGAACRAVASPIAGLLYGLSTEMRFTPLAWWGSALVAFAGALQIPFLVSEAVYAKRACLCTPGPLWGLHSTAKVLRSPRSTPVIPSPIQRRPLLTVPPLPEPRGEQLSRSRPHSCSMLFI